MVDVKRKDFIDLKKVANKVIEKKDSKYLHKLVDITFITLTNKCDNAVTWITQLNWSEEWFKKILCFLIETSYNWE